MKKTSFFLLILAWGLISLNSVHAKITLPAILSSNMVLQRNTEVTLWGKADVDEVITIKVSWLADELITQAGKEGNWNLKIKTDNSKESQTIHIKSKTSDILLENILLGEVWLCSGQSNMEQPMKGYINQPTFESLKTIKTSYNTNIRLFTIERHGSKTPLNDVEQYRPWEEAVPENVSNFSAIAYFFGQQLQEILNVPVGIIHSSWAGSSIEPWISNEALSPFQATNLDDVDLSQRTNYIPTALFNAMINPIIPFGIKGVLWYQGESNRKEPEQYKKLFPAMVNDWRTRWGIGDFPFFYVQIAPFPYRNYEAFQSVENSAFMREAQLQCLDIIPNSGIAITMDIGETSFIHPPYKKEVADRLLYNALNKTYGFKGLDCESPIYDSMQIIDSGVMLSFKHAENGLYSYGELEGFEIAGNDRVFYPASAQIVNNQNKLFVQSNKVPEPVAVRYAWRNWIVGTLFGTNLLPASSFRTDNWTNSTRDGFIE